ncbi:DUF2829 domain-containing protein [Flavobacterium sp.]|uniref:DUF2829 domain-containing protein n=1 Tax=Flavobacterium sp. TaxID=239 RepID=UPI003D6C6CC1
MNNNLNFGQAIEALKKGHKVAREGWNGKAMYLFMQVGNTVAKNFIPNFKSLPDSVKDHLTTLKKDVVFNSSITMFTAAQEMQPGWLASQTDMLSNDWVVLSDDYVAEKKYSEKELTDFGFYMVSGQRTRRIIECHNPDEKISIEEKLTSVYDADFRNWQNSKQ